MRALHAIMRAAGVILLLAIVVAGGWLVSWALVAPRPRISGTLVIPGLQAPTSVARDARGIPHLRARSLHDAFEAQGYLEAQDRLFQMDLLRRFVGGRLAEVFGPSMVSLDLHHRELGTEAIAQDVYAHMPRIERLALDAFAQGVNAAIAAGPLPPEFRALLYHPQPWRPQDSILCGLATAIDLTHTWNQIALREAIDERVGPAAAAALYPITDPAYDAPLLGPPAPVAAIPPLSRGRAALGGLRAVLWLYRTGSARPEASNDWAVGGAHTSSGRALLANDPHLDYTVPMVWYAIALRAPGLDVVGASLPGTPGVILGHNAHLAWGVTNGTVSTVTLYRERIVPDSGGRYVYVDPRTHRARQAAAQVETIGVRGSGVVQFTRLETVHGFVLFDRRDRPTPYAAEWVTQRDPRSPLEAFLRLDRASTLEQALRVLREYPGPPQNFVLADDHGRVAYHLSGFIPNDGVWGMHAVDGSRIVDAWHGYVPFDALPHVNPSRDAVVYTANNRVYGAGYPYRLTDAFGAPYRASRIRALLRERSRLTVRDMERMQLDDLSLPELELVRDMLGAAHRHPSEAGDPATLRLLRAWDGRFDGASRAATIAYALRLHAERDFAVAVLGEDLGPAWLADAGSQAMGALLRVLREHPRGWFADGNGDGLLLRALREAESQEGTPSRRWHIAGATVLRHPLANLRIGLFDPGSIPGWGDAFTVKVQTPVYGQSFRAVWEVGAWDRGGMVFPLGESGRPRTPHYADMLPAWEHGEMEPFTWQVRR